MSAPPPDWKGQTPPPLLPRDGSRPAPADADDKQSPYPCPNSPCPEASDTFRVLSDLGPHPDWGTELSTRPSCSQNPWVHTEPTVPNFFEETSRVQYDPAALVAQERQCLTRLTESLRRATTEASRAARAYQEAYTEKVHRHREYQDTGALHVRALKRWRAARRRMYQARRDAHELRRRLAEARRRSTHVLGEGYRQWRRDHPTASKEEVEQFIGKLADARQVTGRQIVRILGVHFRKRTQEEIDEDYRRYRAGVPIGVIARERGMTERAVWKSIHNCLVRREGKTRIPSAGSQGFA